MYISNLFICCSFPQTTRLGPKMRWMKLLSRASRLVMVQQAAPLAEGLRGHRQVWAQLTRKEMQPEAALMQAWRQVCFLPLTKGLLLQCMNLVGY